MHFANTKYTITPVGVARHLRNAKTAKLSREVFRRVEKELYSYSLNKNLAEVWDKELAEKILSMALPVCDFHTMKNNKSWPQDSTGEIAVKIRLLNQRAEWAKLSCMTVESVVKALDEQERTLVGEKYFNQKLTDMAIARMLHISIREFYYMRKKIVKKFAEAFGWMGVEQ